MKQLHFNFKDIFRSARLAFSIQRIWLNGLVLLAGYLLYLIISYVSLLAAGYDFSTIWGRLGLLPCAFVMVVVRAPGCRRPPSAPSCSTAW